MSVTKKPRVNFASVKNPLPYPDFLEVQLKSFRDFLQLDTPTRDSIRFLPRISLLRTLATTLYSNSLTIISTRRATQSRSAWNVASPTVCR